MEPMSDTPRRRMTAPQRRDEILDAAATVIARSGYDGCSLEQIAT